MVSFRTEMVSTYPSIYSSSTGDSANHSAFPGFEAAFRTAWPEKPVIEIPVAANDVARSIRLSDRHLAIHETVSLFADPVLRKLREEEIAVDLCFIVIPDDVYLYGRPLSKVPRSEQVAIQQSINQHFAKRLQTSPSLFEEDMRLAEKYLYGVDFHNQLKARLLLGKVTTQVVRESSLLQLVEPNATEFAQGACKTRQQSREICAPPHFTKQTGALGD